jgi:hypothetical protein
VALVGGVALAIALVGGVAGASSTTSEGIVSVTPHVLTTGASVAAGKSVTYVVSGGSTTVPSDATRVQFAATVSKQQQPGSLTSQPYLDAADASGDSLSWGAPNTTVSGTFLEPVGVANKVIFTNTSAGTVTVAVKITGYSTAARLAARLDSAESRLNADETNIGTAQTNITNLQAAHNAAHTGFSSSIGLSLTSGDNYVFVTLPFTPTALMFCVVTSNVQFTLVSPAAVGAPITYLRNAIRRDGTAVSNDGFFGHYFTATGQTGMQPDVSRTSQFLVSPGHQVEFGAYIANVAASWFAAGNTVSVATQFDCH